MSDNKTYKFELKLPDGINLINIPKEVVPVFSDFDHSAPLGYGNISVTDDAAMKIIVDMEAGGNMIKDLIDRYRGTDLLNLAAGGKVLKAEDGKVTSFQLDEVSFIPKFRILNETQEVTDNGIARNFQIQAQNVSVMENLVERLISEGYTITPFGEAIKEVDAKELDIMRLLTKYDYIRDRTGILHSDKVIQAYGRYYPVFRPYIDRRGMLRIPVEMMESDRKFLIEYMEDEIGLELKFEDNPFVRVPKALRDDI